MADLPESFAGGLVSSRDRADLERGELQTADGVWYKPGDPRRVHVLEDLSTYGDTGSGAKIKGVDLALFDATSPTDRLLAFSDTILYSGTPGATGTPTTELVTGLDSTATTTSSVHSSARDTVYWCNGVDSNRGIESDGDVRLMGIASPQIPPTAAAATGGSVQRADAADVSNTGWVNTANAKDADEDTYASATLSASGTSTLVLGWATDSAVAGRKGYVRWGLAGVQSGDEDTTRDDPSTRTTDAGFNVDIRIRYTLDADAGTPTWTTLLEETGVTSARTSQAITFDITDALDLTVKVQVEARIVYNSGTSSGTMRLFDVRSQNGGTSAVGATTNGVRYAITWYDADTGDESPQSDATGLITLDAANTHITVTRDTDETAPARVTHWRIYRTPDPSGVVPVDLGLVGQTPIASTTFLDLFDVASDTQATPLLPLLEATVGSGTQYYSPNQQPPAFQHISEFNGSLVGTKPNGDIRYTSPGFPEGWPEIYVLIPASPAFGTMTVSDQLIIIEKDGIERLNELVLVENNSFATARKTAFRGQPGGVGVYGFTEFSVFGESRGAWVSRFGVHETNGTTARRISDDLDWENEVTVANLSTAVLRWDQTMQALILLVDTNASGTNDKAFIFHMAREHQKSNGMPKITTKTITANCIATGIVSGTPRVYFGDHTSGEVDLWRGGSGGSYTIKTRRMFARRRLWQCNWLNLHHTDLGSGKTATLTWTANNDAWGESDSSVVETVDMSDHQGEEVFIHRSQESAEVTISGTSGDGSILGMDMYVEEMDRAGERLASS